MTGAAAVMLMTVPSAERAAAQERGSNGKNAQGSYASVNGLNVYYEVHGRGRPLVLLHGGGSTIDTSFGKVLPSFAKTRQVIAFEQQGHGHTADVDPSN